MHPENRDRLSSVQNAIRLLNIFSVDEPELGISELSEKLGLAKSTVHRLVTTLASEGLIAKDMNTNLYRLGISILAISNVLTSTTAIHRAALPFMEDLAKRTKESVLFGVFRVDEVFFLNRVIGGLDFIPALSAIGSRVDPHCTSSGQVLLAYESKDTVDRILTKGLKAYTKKTITDKQRIYELLEKVRAQGYAVSIEELHPAITSVAAPIRNSNGQVVATVSLPGPSQRMTRDTLPLFTKQVLQAASEIAIRFQQLQ